MSFNPALDPDERRHWEKVFSNNEFTRRPVRIAETVEPDTGDLSLSTLKAMPEAPLYPSTPDELFARAEGLYHCQWDFQHYLVFVLAEPRTYGFAEKCTLLAYPCDHTGAVTSWARRYVLPADDVMVGLTKLRLMLANGLLELRHIEN